MTPGTARRFDQFMRLLRIAAMMMAPPSIARADPDPAHVTGWRFAPIVFAPYAGKYEDRIGGEYEIEADRVRLNAGATIDLWNHEFEVEDNPLSEPIYDARMSIGVTGSAWMHLRSEEAFHVPVEGLDYLVGLDVEYEQKLNTWPPIAARLRFAHIASHAYDEPTTSNDTTVAASRDLLELMLIRQYFWPNVLNGVSVEPYFGAQWIIRSIPDTLRGVTPFAGFDMRVEPFRRSRLGLKLGYEARLNTELAPIGEYLVRVGVVYGNPYALNAGIEVSYYSGRSPYGQRYWMRESYWSLGLMLDF